MKFVCDGCQTRYSIADEKVRQRILRIRCKTCGHVITVQSGEVISGPQGFAGRPESVAQASHTTSARPSSIASRVPASHREWFVAVDGHEQGPLNRSDAARLIVSLKPEQSVRVWKEGMDSWKRPNEVAIIGQEISELRRASAGPPNPLTPAPRAGTSSALRSVPSRGDAVSGVRAPGSTTKSMPIGSSGSGPKPSQPGSGPKSSPALPGSGPKSVPPPIPGSGPKSVPPPIPGSGPKAAPSAVVGSEPKLSPSAAGPGAQPVQAGAASASHKKGPALPGVTPMSHGPSAQEAEFDQAPTTRPERRPSAPRDVVAPGAQIPPMAPPAASRDSVSEDEFDRAEKTPPAGHPLPPIVVPVRGERNAPALPAAASASAISAPPARPSGSLLANVALAPPEPWSAPHQSGLSKLSGLAALTHRHRHLKYVVAAGVVVMLVILVILFSWRTESGNSGPSASSPAAPSREVQPAPRVEPLPQVEVTVTPEVERKGRIPARGASRRSAHPAGRPGKAAPAGDDPFEGPSPSSRLPERPVPLVTPDPSRRSRSGPSGGVSREVSQSQISEVVRNKENQAALKTCYERALKLDGRLHAGRLDITVSISATGGVQNVQVHGPSDFLIIDGCIKGAIRHWRFPPNADEYATSFPLILQGG